MKKFFHCASLLFCVVAITMPSCSNAESNESGAHNHDVATDARAAHNHDVATDARAAHNHDVATDARAVSMYNEVLKEKFKSAYITGLRKELALDEDFNSYVSGVNNELYGKYGSAGWLSEDYRVDYVRAVATYIEDRHYSYTWRHVQQHLSDTEVAVEFTESGDTIYALLLKPHAEAPELIPLTRKFKLDQYLQQFRISGQPWRMYDYAEHKTEFKDMIWSKIVTQVPDTFTINYAPCVPMLNVNMAALPFDSVSIMAEHYRMRHLTSTRTLCRRRMVPYAPVKIAILFGDVKNPALPELSASGTELETAKGFLEGAGYYALIFAGEDCQEQAFVKLNSKPFFDIIHIASHSYNLWGLDILFPKKHSFITDPMNQRQFSGLVFSTPKDTTSYSIQPLTVMQEKEPYVKLRNDGILTCDDIYKLNYAKANLIVAATCYGNGQAQFNDETYGLRAAFKMTGARSSIIGLWDTHDMASSCFFYYFYGYLGMCGDTSFACVQDSYRLALIHTRKHFPNPYYWAVYSLAD